MKLILTLFSLFIFLTGCTQKDIKTLRTDCIKQGKQFTVKKVLNFRSGEYETKGLCS